jgi:hypothetical protein
LFLPPHVLERPENQLCPRLGASFFALFVIILNLIESIWMENDRNKVCALRTPQRHPCREPEGASCPSEARRKNAKDFSVVPKVDLMIASEVWI